MVNKQLIEQKITQQVTIAAGASDTVSVAVPTNGKAFLKGYGYSWFATNTFKLTAGTYALPSRTDQEGSTSIPVIYGNPFPANSGESFSLHITNGDASDHTYDVVFYVLSDRIIEVNSVGGELILTTGGTGGLSSGVIITNASDTITANVTANGLEVDQQSASTLLCGTKTAGSTAAALASSTACKKVTIQVATGGGNVYVGNATSQTILLVPTQTMDIEINDLAKVYVKRVSVDTTVNYLGA